jgi:DNA-binding GntR family transcriptional regulator
MSIPKRKPIVLQHTRESLSEGVFRTLRKAILEGEFKPGEWLRQENLADELQVSQATVRDALNQLVGEGLAVRIPYKGVHVSTLSFEELETIYAMRALLEGLAAKSAAKKISKEALQEMKDILSDTIVNNDPESVPMAREANRRFHEIFIEASQRRFLIRTLNQILDWIDPMMLYSRTMKTEIGLETRLKWGERDRFQHTRLVAALEAGDSEFARQVATEAVEEAWNNLAELIFEKSNGE